jgi:hypothetical protein
MKKNVFMFSILALLVMLVAVFAMTSSARACVIVPASVVANGPPSVYTITSTTTLPSGLVITKADFTIPNLLTIGTKGYDTNCVSTFTAVLNPNTHVLTFYFDGRWQVIGSSTNGFRFYPWSFIATEYNYYPSVGEGNPDTVQVVAQGFGTFAGETLVLHYDGPNQLTGTWTGYVFMR